MKVYYHDGHSIFCDVCGFTCYPHPDNFTTMPPVGERRDPKYRCPNEQCEQHGRWFERKPVEADVVEVI